MVSTETRVLAQRGEEIYRSRLRTQLESTHRGQFVSIEPESGDYFLGRTLDEAIAAARRIYPERLTYTCRIGFSSAVEIGCWPC
jgi:hypothetical protein